MKHLLLSCLALFCLSLSSCERENPIATTEEVTEAEFIEENLAEQGWDPCLGNYNCTNCVGYARCRLGIAEFPLNLSTIVNKCSLINRTYAQAGWAVIIDAARPYGHIGYVSYVYNNGDIRIHEGNWNGWCNYRTISGSDPSIIGYYDPTASVANKNCSHYGH